LPPERWEQAQAALDSGAALSVGLQCTDVAAAVPALQGVLMAGGAQPAMLATPMHPMVRAHVPSTSCPGACR
jgi:hypothetical protein